MFLNPSICLREIVVLIKIVLLKTCRWLQPSSFPQDVHKFRVPTPDGRLLGSSAGRQGVHDGAAGDGGGGGGADASGLQVCADTHTHTHTHTYTYSYWRCHDGYNVDFSLRVVDRMFENRRRVIGDTVRIETVDEKCAMNGRRE